jgi:hypothetical protein
MKILRRLMIAVPPILMTVLAAAQPSSAAQTAQSRSAPTLMEKVRAATERFRDINVATAAGFVPGTPCVSGPDTGAMGVHFVMGDRITNFVLQADQPQALIYEPLAGGGFRLVGVEYIVLASNWIKQPNGTLTTPELEGDLMNYESAPNRFGLPAFYELHVWAWEDNPKGSFADWNTHVTCEKQAGD